MNSRKEVKNCINHLVSKLDEERRNLNNHKQYFEKFKRENKYLFLLFLIPTFLGGWQEGKHVKHHGIKKFGRFMLGTAFTALKSPKLLSFIRK